MARQPPVHSNNRPVSRARRALETLGALDQVAAALLALRVGAPAGAAPARSSLLEVVRLYARLDSSSRLAAKLPALIDAAGLAAQVFGQCKKLSRLPPARNRADRIVRAYLTVSLAATALAVPVLWLSRPKQAPKAA